MMSLGLDRAKVRTAFFAYGAMNRKDWRQVKLDNVDFDPKELSRQLTPTLRTSARDAGDAEEYGRRLVEETKDALGFLFPFTDAEMEFLDRLLDYGEIHPALLTDDADLAARLRTHPLLEWKALNVRKHKGWVSD